MAYSGSLARRKLLGGLAGVGAGSLAGCLAELRAIVTHSTPDPISLTVKTLPGDEDPIAVSIGRQLRSNLEAAGIDAEIELMTEHELLRDVLFDFDFDLVVARSPGHVDPDDLRPLLHSVYTEEVGWQNPFGISSQVLDDLLEEQSREQGEQRRETVAELQHEFVSRVPFAPVVSAKQLTAVRDDVDAAWERGTDHWLLGYLSAGRVGEPLDELRVGVLQPHSTVNRNILAPEYRTSDHLIELLYDPLARRIGGEFVPWLASDWSYDPARSRLAIELRDGLSWHDGRLLTLDDVAFTYQFLSDTALGDGDVAVPAPRFREATSLVEDVRISDEQYVELDLVTCGRETCERVLSVPVFPSHQWEDHGDVVGDVLSEALLADIDEPIGSGPFQFESTQQDEALTLSRFDDHFLADGRSLPAALDPYAEGPGIQHIDVFVPPNELVAVELLSDGELDVVASGLRPEGAQEVQQYDNVRVHVREPGAYYFVGFNLRRHPLGDHQFRTILARLVDRAYVADATADIDNVPINSPLHATDAVPEDLEWTGDSVFGSFPGSEGEVEEPDVRELFEGIGYRYDEQGQLVTRQ